MQKVKNNRQCCRHASHTKLNQLETFCDPVDPDMTRHPSVIICASHSMYAYTHETPSVNRSEATLDSAAVSGNFGCKTLPQQACMWPGRCYPMWCFSIRQVIVHLNLLHKLSNGFNFSLFLPQNHESNHQLPCCMLSHGG